MEKLGPLALSSLAKRGVTADELPVGERRAAPADALLTTGALGSASVDPIGIDDAPCVLAADIAGSIVPAELVSRRADDRAVLGRRADGSEPRGQGSAAPADALVVGVADSGADAVGAPNVRDTHASVAAPVVHGGAVFAGLEADWFPGAAVEDLGVLITTVHPDGSMTGIVMPRVEAEARAAAIRRSHTARTRLYEETCIREDREDVQRHRAVGLLLACVLVLAVGWGIIAALRSGEQDSGKQGQSFHDTILHHVEGRATGRLFMAHGMTHG